MTRAQTLPGGYRRGTNPTGGGPPTGKIGVPVLVTLVEAPACQLREDANSALAVLGASYPLRVNEVSITGEPGRALMQEHRAPMSPLVLFGPGVSQLWAPSRRNLEPRLEKARAGVAHA